MEWLKDVRVAQLLSIIYRSIYLWMIRGGPNFTTKSIRRRIYSCDRLCRKLKFYHIFHHWISGVPQPRTSPRGIFVVEFSTIFYPVVENHHSTSVKKKHNFCVSTMWLYNHMSCGWIWHRINVKIIRKRFNHVLNAHFLFVIAQWLNHD